MILVYIISIITLIISTITLYLNFENYNKDLGNKFFSFEKSTHLLFSFIKIFKNLISNKRNYIQREDFTNYTFVYKVDNILIKINVFPEDGKLPLKKESFYLNAFENLLNILEIEDNNFISDIKTGKINLDKVKTYFDLEKLLDKYFPKKDTKKLLKYLGIFNRKININVAPYQVILALDEKITQDEVISIIKARPIKDILKLQKYLPSQVYWSIYPYLKTKSSYFRLDVNLISKDVNYNMTSEIYFENKNLLYFYFKDNWDRKWLLNYFQENVSI